MSTVKQEKEKAYRELIDTLYQLEEEARKNGTLIDENILKKADRVAFELEDGHILRILGAMYFEGNGVKQDQEKAVKYYKEGSEYGDAQSSSNLGFCYYYGNGVKQSYEEAFKYFNKAVLLGSLEAKYMLADMYRDGLFVQKDEKLAFKIYKDLVDRCKNDEVENSYLKHYQQIYSAACIRLATCYLYGKGIEQDLLKAEYYNSIARYYYLLRKSWGDYYCEPGLRRVYDNEQELKRIVRNKKKAKIN